MTGKGQIAPVVMLEANGNQSPFGDIGRINFEGQFVIGVCVWVVRNRGSVQSRAVSIYCHEVDSLRAEMASESA